MGSTGGEGLSSSSSSELHFQDGKDDDVKVEQENDDEGNQGTITRDNAEEHQVLAGASAGKKPQWLHITEDVMDTAVSGGL